MLQEFSGRHIRIGYTNGSGFVYCGHCGVWTAAEILAEQEVLTAEANRIMKDALTEFNFLERIGVEGFCHKEVERSWKEYRARMAGRVFKLQYKPPDRATMVGKYEKKLQVCKRAIDKYTWCVEHPNMILEAVFVSAYQSIDPEEPDTIIILLEGDINGKYWNEKEYKNRYTYEEKEEEDEQDADE